MVGAEDTLTPMADAQLLHQSIKASQLKVIPHAGHYAVFEDPEETARVMRAFMDDLRA